MPSANLKVNDEEILLNKKMQELLRQLVVLMVEPLLEVIGFKKKKMKSINIDVMDNGLRENLKVNGEEIPLNGLQLKPLLGVILEPVLKEAGVEKELGELLKSNSINIKITK